MLSQLRTLCCAATNSCDDREEGKADVLIWPLKVLWSSFTHTCGCLPSLPAVIILFKSPKENLLRPEEQKHPLNLVDSRIGWLHAGVDRVRGRRERRKWDYDEWWEGAKSTQYVTIKFQAYVRTKQEKLLKSTVVDCVFIASLQYF